jgi:predicted enzyme related to lactoylglutathione lyase
MHKSRLCAIVIDCQTDDIDAAGRFWGQALGRAVKEEDEKYRSLARKEGELHVLLQKVNHESRVHLDIETDDVEAEAARLEKLGAKKIEKVRTWWVMQAPSGQKFCVVRPQSGPLGDDANVWE